MTTEDGQPTKTPSGPLDWHVLLELLGAAAGIGAFVIVVGGALLWVRFDAAGLPADRAVTLVPRTLLVTVGAHALIVPALLGVLGVLGTLWLHPVTWSSSARWIALIGVVLTLAIALVIAAIASFELDVFPEMTAVAVAVVVAVFAILATAHYRDAFRPIGWVVFLSFLFVGAVLAIARTSNEPKLEPVALALKSPAGTVAGFLVAETGDRVYLAELTGISSGSALTSAKPVDTVIAVDRSRVTRLSMRAPEGAGPGDAGREEAQSLLEDLLAAGAPTAAVEPVRTSTPEVTFAPAAYIHSHERVLPTSTDYFFAHAWLMFAEAGRCPDYAFALGDNVPPQRRDPKRLAGTVDQARLGAGRYGHAVGTAGCGDSSGPQYTSTQVTRPFETTGRPPGLDVRAGFYLDLDDAARHPKIPRSWPRSGGQALLTGVPAYYERHPEGHDLRISYWLFYPLSLPPGVGSVDLEPHEGDWEGMSVLLRPGPRKGEWTPISARYNEHDEHEVLPWAEVRRTAGPDGLVTHPLAYVGQGSHATYPRPGRFEQVLKPSGRRIVAVLDDARACPDCPLWITWQQLVDATRQPWYGFGGAWGQAGTTGDTTGPLGPSIRKTVQGVGAAPENLVK